MVARCCFLRRRPGVFIGSGTQLIGGLLSASQFLYFWPHYSLSQSSLALAASGVGVILFLVFWVARGEVPAGGSELAITWPAIWFPVAGAVFSGVSALDLLASLLQHSSVPILSDVSMTSYVSYVLGPLGLPVIFWVWYR